MQRPAKPTHPSTACVGTYTKRAHAHMHRPYRKLQSLQTLGEGLAQQLEQLQQQEPSPDTERQAAELQVGVLVGTSSNS